MKLPRVWADFNTVYLNTNGTLADLNSQGLELREGMRCIFYTEDADEDGQDGFLHCESEVVRDPDSGFFMMRGGSEYRFTPGNDLALLDPLYPENHPP